MPDVGLSTFAKFVQLPPAKKAQEYAKYLTPGVFDYYGTLHEAIQTATWSKGSLEYGLEQLNSIKDNTRRKHCRNALISLFEILAGEEHKFVQPPFYKIDSPLSFLSVKIRPSVTIVTDKDSHVIAVWANTTMELHKTGAEAMIDLMIKNLKYDPPISQYSVFDLPRKKKFTRTETSGFASAVVAGEFAFADAFFAAAEG